MLERLRADYAISVHGVGRSIGGPDPLDEIHLTRLKTLCDRYQPESFSEHFAWASHCGTWMHDLLPLPYTHETLRIVCDHLQVHLGRQILLERPRDLSDLRTIRYSGDRFSHRDRAAHWMRSAS